MKTLLISIATLLLGAGLASGAVLGVTRPWQAAEQAIGPLAGETPTASPTAKGVPTATVAALPSAIPPTSTTVMVEVVPTQQPPAPPPPPEPSLPPVPPPPTEPPPPPPPVPAAPIPSAVDRWNACNITWAQGMNVEASLASARISGSSTEYLSRQYDILQSYVETNCRGIGSTLALEPGAASACWKILGVGETLEQIRDMSRRMGDATYFVDFALSEVDAFIRAVGC